MMPLASSAEAFGAQSLKFLGAIGDTLHLIREFGTVEKKAVLVRICILYTGLEAFETV